VNDLDAHAVGAPGPGAPGPGVPGPGAAGSGGPPAELPGDAGARAAGAAETGAQRRQRLAALLVAAREGRRDALGSLVAELTPLLWHVARAQGLDRVDAQDVVQTTWLDLLRELDAIRVPEALTAWLVTVARREAVRVRDQRRRGPTDGTDFDAIASPQPGPDDNVLAGERRRKLWAAVGRLPERCRELIRIVAFVERPDYDLVAAALGMPRGGVGPNRGRCLARLRALLSADSDWSWSS
jgi:RNA polymerase sigma factor (sigma-70 family)